MTFALPCHWGLRFRADRFEAFGLAGARQCLRGRYVRWPRRSIGSFCQNLEITTWGHSPVLILAASLDCVKVRSRDTRSALEGSEFVKSLLCGTGAVL